MIAKPMIGDWEVPGIQRIGTVERRRLVEVPVPGLAGSYHQDLGAAPLVVRIEGTLAGDEARDAFLEAVRERFAAGEPVDFVADITTATEVAQVLVTRVQAGEVAGSADTFRYAIELVQYVEPPAPALADGLPGLDDALGLEAGDLFDLMDLPDLLGSIPDIANPLPPVQGVLKGFQDATAGLADALGPLAGLLGKGG